MASKYLNDSGLAYFWSKIKAWCNATFAAITHSHAWSTITGKPTTISGYGITDAKIANGTITLGLNSITPLTSHQDISGKVDKSGDTMTGGLTITNNNVLKFKHTGITRGTAPSTDAYSFFVEFRDNVDKLLGGLYYEYFTNKTAKTHLMCYQGTTNANTWNSIGIGYDASGNVYTWAPTPETADYSTKIATTEFVKAQGYLTSHQSLDGKMNRGSYERIEGTSSAHKDLNAYTVAGFYNVKTANVDNCPSGIGIDAVLLVYPWNSSSYCTQELTESAASSDVRRWVRKCNAITGVNSWSSWRQVAFIDSNEFYGEKVLNDANYWNDRTSLDKRNVTSNAYWDPFVARDKYDRWIAAFHCQLLTHPDLGTQTGLLLNVFPPGNENDPKGLWINIWEKNGSYTTYSGINADHFRPGTGLYTTLGEPGTGKWGQIYSTNATISTSDARQKSSIEALTVDILDAWDSVSFVQFKFADAVSKKGEAARFHAGVVAQSVERVFSGAGLDVRDYGFFCYDRWDAVPESIDPNTGAVIQPAVQPGDEYSIRYEELLCIEAAYQRRENARLKKRIADLEERLAALELRVS